MGGVRGVRPERSLMVVAAVMLAGPAAAQRPAPPPVTIPDSEVHRLTAASNGVEYEIFVGLPNGYDAGRDYPVILTLDRDYSFAITRNVVEHLADRDHLRPAIVVSIGYSPPLRYRWNRTRDYTPIAWPEGGYGPEMQRVSGGGPDFLAFIEDELIPWLDARFGLSGERVLVGHSYGGLFVSWVAVTRPDLFSGIVAVSPSLWYADGWIFAREAELARTRTDLPLRLHLEVGDREINQQWNMPADLRRLARTLRERGYPSLELQSIVAEDETHNSIFPRALSNGLRFVMRGR